MTYYFPLNSELLRVLESTSVALTSLSLDDFALDFTSERTERLVQVAHGVAETAVRATAGAGGTGVRITADGAAVEPGAAIPLAAGGHLDTVTVTRSAVPDTTTASHRWNISLVPASGVRPTEGRTATAVRVIVECNGSSLITKARCPFEAGSATFQIQADGSEVVFDFYALTVLWDGQSRHVDTDALGDATPLVGMALLHSHNLSIDVEDRRPRRHTGRRVAEDRGRVAIERKG